MMLNFKVTMISRFIFFIIFIGAFLFPKIVFSQEIETSIVEYFSYKGTPVRGFLAKPKNSDKKTPGLLLIHEWWGLNKYIKGEAEKYAKEGYTVLAVDLYHGNNTSEPSKAREYANQVRNNKDEAFENLEAALNFLRKDKQVLPNQLATIGWCFGGGWSYQIAKNNLGVKASVIYYGYFNPEDDLQKMRTDIMGHFAEHDRGITLDNVKEFKVKLKNLPYGDHHVYIYPNTTHGFASRKGVNPNYNEKEASLANKRTLEFLKENLVE